MNQKIIMLIFIVIKMSAFTQDTIQGSYHYTYGDNESLVEARKTCKDLAIRDAIESYYIFVESSTEVENATLKEDIINTISAGYMKNLTVIDQTEEGRTISTTVEAEVDPEQVQSLVQKMVNASMKTDQADSNKTASLSSDQVETLESLLARYEKWMTKTETDWNEKNYDSAYSRIQKVQKQLEAHEQKGATSFQKSLYLCIHKRTVLLKHLLRLEQAEQNAKRKIIVRSQNRQVAQDAIQLRDAINDLKSVPVSTQEQKNLRDIWVKRSRTALERAKNKIKGSRG
ncbi:hypothetical protein JW835_03685 [bacterium]|nr:hypothetical protein [bacterium]RQV98246.1 MAG: hypothetical protein EH221_02420 [bacterium]